MSKYFNLQDRVQYGVGFKNVGTIVSGLIQDNRFSSGYYYNIKTDTHIQGYDVSLIKLCNLIVIENSMFSLSMDKYNKTLTLRWKK